MRFFFYGTLMDADVRDAVLGQLAPTEVEPARLQGWRRVPIARATFPVIVRAPGRAVDGVLVRGLNAEARDILTRYEDDGYGVAEVEVETERKPIRARVFVPAAAGPSGSRLRLGRGDWDLGTWQLRHKRRFMAALKTEQMGRRAATRALD